MRTRWMLLGVAGAFLLAAWAPAQEAKATAEAAAAPAAKPAAAPAAKPAAAPKGVPLEKLFKAADTNNDNMLSLEEFKAAAPKIAQMHRAGGPQADMKARLRAADADKDGKVTKEEFRTAFPKATEEKFTALDKNKDGVLTMADAPSAPAPGKGRADRGPAFDAAMVKKADADQDGKVTLEEVQKIRPNLPEEAFKRMDVDGDGVLTEKDAALHRERAAKEMREKMSKADTDGDKKVSFNEAQAAFPGMNEAQFKKRDSNGDGFLSEEDRAVKKP